MSILKLTPACKDYIWGGTKLRDNFNKHYDGERLAETWELSCHKDGPSVILNGVYAGKTLVQYIKENGKQVLGTACEGFEDFPVLIKLIDAKNNLSVQVHPSDDYALEHEHQYGKTEMWYVVDCAEGAELYHGFKHEISEDEFKQRIADNTLTDVLRAVPVHKGDVFFIDSGTIHAIGKNIVIAEIQQNSNVTYRVYDYGRLGTDGKPRELHIDKAVKVTNRCKPEIRDFSPHLGSCKYFTVDKLYLDGIHTKETICCAGSTSFVSILFIEGSGTVSDSNDTVEFIKGDSIFIPANSGEFKISGGCEAIITYLK